MLGNKFDVLKNNVTKCLEKKPKAVSRVADALTSLSPDHDDNHDRKFLESHTSALFRAANTAEQFRTINFHWSYLDPSLLDHLVRDFNLEEVKGEMETYKSDLGQFRKNTPLSLFCRAQKKKRVRLSPDFQEMVTEFDWRNDVTLEVVEQFRQEYADHYGLHEFAMMVAQVSFIVTWFVPESVVEKLKGKVPREILKKYSVIKLEIAGTCVYRLRKLQEVSVTGSLYTCSTIIPLSGSPINQQWSSQCSHCHSPRVSQLPECCKVFTLLCVSGLHHLSVHPSQHQRRTISLLRPHLKSSTVQ